MVRRPLLALVVSALLLAACSSGPSAALRGRRVCATFESFWDTSYSGGRPPANMVVAERAVLGAVADDRHQTLDSAVRGVVAGELSLPLYTTNYSKRLSSLPKPTKERLSAINIDEPTVEAQCDSLGRHISG